MKAQLQFVYRRLGNMHTFASYDLPDLFVADHDPATAYSAIPQAISDATGGAQYLPNMSVDDFVAFVHRFGKQSEPPVILAANKILFLAAAPPPGPTK